MNTTKMEKINNEGKKIIKDIPNELISDYIAIGWKKVDEKTEESKESLSFTSKSSFKDTKSKK